MYHSQFISSYYKIDNFRLRFKKSNSSLIDCGVLEQLIKTPEGPTSFVLFYFSTPHIHVFSLPFFLRFCRLTKIKNAQTHQYRHWLSFSEFFQFIFSPNYLSFFKVHFRQKLIENHIRFRVCPIAIIVISEFPIPNCLMDISLISFQFIFHFPQL